MFIGVTTYNNDYGTDLLSLEEIGIGQYVLGGTEIHLHEKRSQAAQGGIGAKGCRGAVLFILAERVISHLFSSFHLTEHQQWGAGIMAARGAGACQTGWSYSSCTAGWSDRHVGHAHCPARLL